MTAKAQDPYRIGRGGGSDGTTGRGEGGPASKRTTVGYGFWIYLLSDIILFSGFFAAYAVLAKQTAGGPSSHELFGQERVAIETAALLLSSFTCGLSGVVAEKRKLLPALAWLLATGLLGAVFLGLELIEFAEMIGKGAGPQRSAFLSACFGLVGLHGLHIAVGLLWLGTMMAQLRVKGFRPQVLRRLMCFTLFWHALDIVWVGIFTMIYLMGSI